MTSLADQIRTKEFTHARKGFDADEVMAYLDTVAAEVAELEADLRREGVRANALERRIQDPHRAQDNVEAAFLAASETKQNMLSEAEERAAQLVADARAEASKLVEIPKAEAARSQEETSAILLQATERLEGANREAASIEERAKSAAAELEADAAERGRRAVEEAERRAQETVDASRHEAAIRIAAAQRESSDIRSTLEAEHHELVDKVRSLQAAVVGMIEYGAARSPDLAAVLDSAEGSAEGTDESELAS